MNSRRPPVWPPERLTDGVRLRARTGVPRRERTRRVRAVATRYDGLTVRREATVVVAAVDEWL